MVFTDPLVEPVEKVRTVLIAEQQIKLIGKDPGSLSFLPVLDHPVEDAVQGDQHPPVSYTHLDVYTSKFRSSAFFARASLALSSRKQTRTE